MYDLNVYPLYNRQSEPKTPLPGFLVASPRRRAVRSRSEDQLILSLFTTSGADLLLETQRDMLNRLAQTFFKTSGSVTAALRLLIETLNLTMLEHNLKTVEPMGLTTGALTVAAIHRHNLYLAQTGQMHAFVLAHQGLQHFSDTSQSDRGLGVSRTPTIRYYQANLGTGGYFFTTDTPSETWSEKSLSPDQFPSLQQLWRRLFNQAPANFRLDFVQAVTGEGKVHILQSEEQPAADPPSIEKKDESIPESSPLGVPLQEQQVDKELSDTQEIRKPSYLSKDKSNETTTILPSKEPPKKAQTSAAQQVSPSRKESLRKQSEQLKVEGLKGLKAMFLWWRNARESINTFFKDLIARWSPDGSEGLPKLSRRTMLLITISVPLVIVAIAVSIYLVRGRSLQYKNALDQAVAASQQALTAEDPVDSRSEWVQVLAFLDQAESFRTTDEIAALREQAQEALDLLDGAVRLDYHPAIIGSLYSEINITQIVSFGADLYLFDQTGGRVIHAERTSQGYEIDPEFICSAGNYSGGAVDALVDMTALPINNPYQAHILAVDALGNAIYCIPGENPVVQTLPTVSGSERGISQIVFESGYLYLLDSLTQTVYVYQATNGQFLNSPTDFFEGTGIEEKPDISQIVDLDVNGQELYLLRADGMLVDCISSGLPSDPVICENPVTYKDGRIGKENQMFVMPEAAYRSVLHSPPPDPSIYILETGNADIYQFSLQFRLYKRLRPNLGGIEIETPQATAFTIGIDRIAFLAFGHQVFFAYVE